MNSFGAAATADDVLAGTDLTGVNVVVTGGHVGIGLAVTRALARAGAAVTVACRDPARAPGGVAAARLDLLDPTSIDAFADHYLATGRPLHVLVNGAGIMGVPLTRDARGYESHFATNHLGHFHLTHRLLPALRAAHGARVVAVSSAAHQASDIRWDDPHFTTGYKPFLAYAQSKTANVLFAVELDRRWASAGIRGYALHPGMVVGTNLGSTMPADKVRATNLRLGLIDEAGEPIIDPDRDQKTPEQAASTIVFAATSPLLADVGGVYLKDNAVTSDVAPHAVDPTSARRLWEASRRAVPPTPRGRCLGR